MKFSDRVELVLKNLIKKYYVSRKLEHFLKFAFFLRSFVRINSGARGATHFQHLFVPVIGPFKKLQNIDL